MSQRPVEAPVTEDDGFIAAALEHANIPALIRAVIGIAWYGIQTWLASVAVVVLLIAIFPGLKPWTEGGVLGLSPLGWLAFALMWALQLAVFYRGIDLVTEKPGKKAAASGEDGVADKPAAEEEEKRDPTDEELAKRCTVLIDSITKTFGSLIANDRISFRAERGTVHALLGENGAGKSTLMNVLYGLYRPDSGRILLRDRPVTFHSPRSRPATRSKAYPLPMLPRLISSPGIR